MAFKAPPAGECLGPTSAPAYSAGVLIIIFTWS